MVEDNIAFEKVSFRIKTISITKIDEIAASRGHSNRSLIINEAITEYLEKRENPNLIKDQIRRALREDPSLVAEAVQIYAVSQLVKK